MSETIALVSSIRVDQESGYLCALATAMPDEKIALFRSMSAAQRARARTAIVASPDPADGAALPIWPGFRACGRA
ncbi:hypothetical protein J2778_002584 [Paraburkholderia graminis]|uniref:hypothetical protein n=1 Tax=Paraburkholderia graminis TaxID=60548 RepID=UPI00285792DA|nr:hypothetical protein [Paraburkholderia graminis]MDR6475090.1 hypothetical protein [Paraburkholderia graminis]